MLSLEIIEEFQDIESVVEAYFLVLTQFPKDELHSVGIVVDKIESGFHVKVLRRPVAAYEGKALNRGLSARG